MVEPLSVEKLDAVAVKVSTWLLNIVAIGTVIGSWVKLTPSLPSMKGTSGLNIVLWLGILCAILYGSLWTRAEKLFGSKIGAGGGGRPPTGRLAVVLSVCVTLPLAIVPPLFQRVFNIQILLPSHWRAILVVVVLGSFGHLIMYGTNSNGIRQRFAPTWEYRSFPSAVFLEAIYSLGWFSMIVLPYRLIVSPNAPWTDLLFARFLLPAFAFFAGMVLFLGLKYPDSLHDRRGTELRGLISGLIMMVCFCGGLFL